MAELKKTPQAKDASPTNALKRRSPSKDKASSATVSEPPTKTSKKRRKVNHACIYCRRSHMTCDLPRESIKKSKSEPENPEAESETPKNGTSHSDTASSVVPQQTSAPDAGLNLGPPLLPPNRVDSTTSVAPSDAVSAPQLSSLTSTSQPFLNYDDLFSSSQNNFQDMHPSYMFNTPEVGNEYNLLNDFLNNSLMDDGAFYGGGDFHTLFSDASLMNSSMGTLTNNSTFNPNASRNAQLLPPPAQTASSNEIRQPPSRLPIDKARERYLMTAADPAGSSSDSPEERMNKYLKAKMDAGLLKPFNYVKGYARLNQYMEQNLQQISRVRVLRQLDRFRPKFRERMEKLTDVDLVRIEMWFDKSLMEYDRVFASMAIPACCWRRTGEIYRGNKEMARLIHVPMSKFRDGTIALHDIIAEPSLVSYWEKFGAIAFDHTQKAILTSCSLKNPDPKSKDPEIRCCFSFTVKRDMWNIPALIVGNFLPITDATSGPLPAA
ncbi:uncharacterized protein K460DRAFT_271430 [Cucurbitaria berberidis CBS 394.84]|uniref:ERT1/acuK family PAS domain-containing protein n=1 Tax=Cucurbitaria berberidis CBS 394.84 TaxID=1168544 RepID=A0A9P4LED9_9PLEO|nr:uncharacterized protein K460DRAFT_271430 [Cucurbitaria berberidis CBS 394.84]KAF1851945.1 hypothetical protein K460DRAFT_271430 [Cucurbitaria berberidis CBS 394.84]